jgi:hypothetical protein
MSKFLNLHEQAQYLKGARDVLLRLQECCEHYVIPYVHALYNSNLPGFESAIYKFPIPVKSTKDRRLVGEALIKTLTEDKQAMARFILGDFQGMSLEVTERDKKGNVKQIKVVVK